MLDSGMSTYLSLTAVAMWIRERPPRVATGSGGRRPPRCGSSAALPATHVSNPDAHGDGEEDERDEAAPSHQVPGSFGTNRALIAPPRSRDRDRRSPTRSGQCRATACHGQSPTSATAPSTATSRGPSAVGPAVQCLLAEDHRSGRRKLASTHEAPATVTVRQTSSAGRLVLGSTT